MKRCHVVGICYIVLAAACYGITPILSNAALSGGLPSAFIERIFGGASGESALASMLVADPVRSVSNETLVFFSMGFACIISLFSCIISKKKPVVTKKQLISLAGLGGGALAAMLLLITYAYLRIPAGMAVVLNCTYPVFVVLFGLIFFREKPRVSIFVSIALATFGVALISSSALSGRADPVGILLALGSALAYAVYFSAGRRSSYASLDGAVSNLYITGFASLVGLVTALIASRFSLPADAFILLLLLLEAVIGYVIALRLVLAGIRLLGAATASALSMLEPVFASLTSMAILGEAIGLYKWTGIALVVAGAVISILLLKKAPASD